MSRTRNLALASALSFQMLGTPIATFSKSADNIIENTIEIAGKTDLTTDIINIIPKIETQASQQFANTATTLIKKAPNATAKQGKLVMLEGVDQLYDVLAIKIDNLIDYLIIKPAQAGSTPVNLPIYRVVRESTEENPKCTFCPNKVGNTKNSQLCQKLEQLGINTQNNVGVQKLCDKGIDVVVLNKVLALTIAKQKFCWMILLIPLQVI
ncbi:MAG: hypothetical protein HC854_01855 [Flavobacterium sp.]|nr:hypothetical protein [Flavobacterium sp.]